ncbi:MAG: hypothetical protein ACI90V_008612, partial [Bacillariaceae sp.]
IANVLTLVPRRCLTDFLGVAIFLKFSYIFIHV